MAKLMIGKKQIVNYYDSAEIDYKLFWNLNSSAAMHYGYWDKRVKTLPEALEKENEILAEKVKIKKSDIVLDAGCGVGGSSIFLAKKYRCNVIGITLSKKQANSASEKAKKAKVTDRTKFFVMDYEHTTFSSKKFDVVWAIESFCHAENKKQFIEESFRILKPNGRIIIADGFTKKEAVTASEKDIMNKFLSGFQVNYLETPSNIKIFLKKAGFQKITYMNITKNILPSSVKMYRYTLSTLLLGKVAEWLKFRTKIQTENIMAARYQYEALQKDLWEYGIFYAEKPNK